MKQEKLKNRGITLIALVITIIVMLILVAVTVSVALNGGLIGKTNEAVEETEKAQFIESAYLAYADLYLQKERYSNSSLITLEELTTKLINDYGYAEKITQVKTKGVADITLNPERLTLEQGKSGIITVTLGESQETTEAYVKIRGGYYKIIIEGTKVVLGEKQRQIPTGENTVAELVTESNNEKVKATVEDTNIKIEAEQDATVGDTTITVKCGTVAKEITVTITEVKSIKLNKYFIDFNKIDEKTTNLKATLVNLTGPVTWTSSKPDVATVSAIDDTSATVQLVSDGVAIIEAECEGFVAQCTVVSGGLKTASGKLYGWRGKLPRRDNLCRYDLTHGRYIRCYYGFYSLF